ncbi:MAG: hypothetical protein HY223_08135 [Thaumarchaeota archaeon]|nr:hypothetical protein [Nitrososphaerota archaeon]
MKEPHNYRKVGYSMIVISVSLTVIGLIAWAIGSNYHFGTELMAGQEIDAMTPKHGYNIVSFDYSAPVGSKLRLLDHTDSINDTKKLQDQYQQNADGFQTLLFGNSRDSNVDLVAHAEISAFTPNQGYNVIFFNNAMPVGAKLALNKHDDSLVNATADEQKQQEENKDPDIRVIIMSSSYADNLKMVLGSSSSVGEVSAQPVTPTPLVTMPNVSPVTNTSASMNNNNASAAISPKFNATNSTFSPQTGPEALTLVEKENATMPNVNQTTTNGTNKSADLGENIGITSK